MTDKPSQPPIVRRSKLLAPKIRLPEMVLIPEGEFIMGTSDDQVRDLVYKEEWAEEWYDKDLFQIEQPQHIVYLQAFEIARRPITNIEYHQFVWGTGYRVPKEWIGFHYPEALAEHPVVGVSKEDALAYCDWLNKQTNSKYRLPTEAEWECASRGDDDRLYPWGNEFDPWRCNTVESGKRGTTAVGIYSPSGDSSFGMIDMSGNVWEWTASLMMPYPYDANDGREAQQSKAKWVIRGGSWYYSRKLARCSAREGAIQTFTSAALGFRLARTPE
jgi:formylglycine-generating enzyme required for sulfatase activity